MMKGMKQTDPQFKLRLPPELKAELETAAEAGGKTLTGEIVDRLEAVSALRKDNEKLGKYVHERDNIGKVLEAVLEMLARFYVTTHAQLPPKASADETLQAPLHFAKALLAKRRSGLAGAYAQLFAATDPRTRPAVTRFKEELVAFPAKFEDLGRVLVQQADEPQQSRQVPIEVTVRGRTMYMVPRPDGGYDLSPRAKPATKRPTTLVIQDAPARHTKGGAKLK